MTEYDILGKAIGSIFLWAPCVPVIITATVVWIGTLFERSSNSEQTI
jgi:hypothetical protein